MSPRLQRARALLQRLRVDRRVPPPVADLYRETTWMRIREWSRRLLYRTRPAAGTATSACHEAALGRRRINTAGPLDTPLCDLAHDVATAVSAAWTAADIEHFVVDRRGDAIEFGVELADRTAALHALVAVSEPGWFLEWADGSRTGVVPLADAVAGRHVQRAREWIVFRAHSWGDRAVGREQGAVVSFWELGASGQLERIAMRSQERFDPRCPVTVEHLDGRQYPGRSAFPVGANLEHLRDPVDVVFTWVDGDDPDWRTDLRNTAEQVGRVLDEPSTDPARFHSRDELRYSLRSVWAHCGWVRRIWIVTAGQQPAWLADDPRITVVDHTEILPASALPTFNSHAIEAALHHIEGLAEHFIYFNDDMFIAQSLRPEQFFAPNGLARVFQSSARPPGVEDEFTRADETGARRGRELLAATFGRVASGTLYHSPYPLLRSVMIEMEERFSDIVTATQHSRFRSPSDLSTASSFASHYALATGRAVLGEVSTEYVNVESGRLQWHLDRIRLNDRLQTYCINETRRNAERLEAERRIAEFFEWMLPVAAPWER